MTRKIAGLSVLAAAAVAASASADTFMFQKDSFGGVNNSAGQFDSITSTFNDADNTFTWSVTFSNQVTDGFTLAVNNGPNPKSNPGQMALIYFDATNPGDIAVTAYGYNGKNDTSSYFDGDIAAGIQSPDFILGNQGTQDGSWLTSASSIDGVDGSRTLSVTMDASIIQGHSPLYPDGDGEPWTGVAFDDKIGVWFHTFKNLSTSYDAEGMLTQWSFGQQGYFDGTNFTTIPVPLPTAAWIGLAGLGFVAARRRRA